LAKVRIEKVIVLPRPIPSRRPGRWIRRIIGIAQRRRRSSLVRDRNLRMLFVEPGWNRISRRSQNGLDPRLIQTIEYALHPRKLKITIARLPSAPGGLAHTHHGDPSLAHQLDISIEPVIGHVLGVVRDAIEDG